MTHRDSDALSVLATALETAKSEGYIRTFVDEGKPMAKLLAMAVKKGIHPEYAGRLLEAFSMPRSDEMPGQKGRLIAPLSERKLEVIVLIAGGYSNKEIAQRLHVSVRTVKYYTTGIYTKLEVEGRAHAAVKAKELGSLR